MHRTRFAILAALKRLCDTRDSGGSANTPGVQPVGRASTKRCLVAGYLDPMIAATVEGKARDGQDLVAGWLNDWQPGFFVDLGAQDGIRKSNSWLLEKRFGWNGICVDANPSVATALRESRSAIVDVRVVHRSSGKRLQFRDITTSEREGESHLVEYAARGVGTRHREVEVVSVTLRDLLQEHCAPGQIDYLSVDLEGAELDALCELADLPHRFSFISCEHDRGPGERALKRLFESAGYHVILADLSRNEIWAVDDLSRLEARLSPSLRRAVETPDG